MTLSSRDSNTRRLLDATVGGYFGRPLTYRRGDTVLFEGKARVTVNDAEQNLDGSALEVDLRGYNLRLRRYLMADGFEPALGDIVELATPFMGKTLFLIDGTGHAFGRGGDQILMSMTPPPASSGLTIPASDSAPTAPPRGRSLG